MISHDPYTEHSIQSAIEGIKARMSDKADVPVAARDEQLGLVDQLAAFELGRFLLVNHGLDAAWTHRLVTYEPGSAASGTLSELEYVVFEELPAVLATRERFNIFRRELQARLTPDSVLASVPCGWMGDLLTLDYRACAEVKLIGVDLDPAALEGAQKLAARCGVSQPIALYRANAWGLKLSEPVDLLTSNGLNIYEPDSERVTLLYRNFFASLKPGGYLVTSFLTPPPSLSSDSSWNMATIDHTLLALQQVLFTQVIEAKWSTFRTHAQTSAQLESAGFENIIFFDDRFGMFPTVVAQKPQSA
nr:class I SAM-dependent methyltransferase [Burkholderia sp. Ac-20384]